MPDNKRTKTVTVEYDLATPGPVTIVAWLDPDDSDNQERGLSVAYDLQPIALAHPAIYASLAAVGFGHMIRSRNPSRDSVHEISRTLYGKMLDGTWTPTYKGEAEPTDLQLALAEVTGTPIHVVQQAFEEQLDRNADGTPKTLVRNGKTVYLKKYNKAYCAALEQQAAVKPVLARLVAERAARLAAEAKQGGNKEIALDSLFSFGEAAQ